MRFGTRPSAMLAAFLLAAPLLVHCPHQAKSQAQPSGQASSKKRQATPQVRYGSEGLPAPVRELRDAILAAAGSGRIEELAEIYEMGDLKPDLGADPKANPGAHWKAISGDGQGREVLAALSLILETGYLVQPLGKDIENNRVYVWPYFADFPLQSLSPAQEVELLRLLPVAAVKEMKAKGRYTHWQIVIGAEGSWHAFRKNAER